MCGTMMSTTAYRTMLDDAGYTPVDTVCPCGAAVTDLTRGKDGYCKRCWCVREQKMVKRAESNKTVTVLRETSHTLIKNILIQQGLRIDSSNHSKVCVEEFCIQIEGGRYDAKEVLRAFRWFERGWKQAANRLV